MKPYDNPFWGFEQRYQEINNKKRKRLITKNSGHLRLCQQPRAAHALRLDQNKTQLSRIRGYVSLDLGGPKYEKKMLEMLNIKIQYIDNSA